MIRSGLMHNAAMDEDLLRQRAKQMMRKRFRSARRAVPAEARAKRSAKLCQRLREHDSVQQATGLALFYPIVRLGEVDLRTLDLELREAGKRLAYPRMQGPAPAMEFCWVNGMDELEDRGNGFYEPLPDAEVAKALDVIVVPGLAFDAKGNRLGYGGGCYDDTLPRFEGAQRIGVAFDFQLASDLPIRTADIPVHCIVTDRQAIQAKLPTSS